MAPELIDPGHFGLNFVRTPASDIYAFGCVCLELYTGQPPFFELSEPTAMLRVLNGERPVKPGGESAMSEVLWRYIMEYWTENHASRPTIDVAVYRQHLLLSLPHSLDAVLPSGSHESTPSQKLVLMSAEPQEDQWVAISSGSMSEDRIMEELRRIVSRDNVHAVYSKTEQIGEGPTGDVYLGKAVSTGVKVVIKHKDVSLTPHRPLKLAVNEVFALRSLNHPNIISYIDSYLLDKNTLWLVMENMEGGTLREIIHNNQPGMQEDQMSRICFETCKGLTHLHRQNIIHRNLRSHCVLFNSLGEVKIAGLGLCAKLKDQHSNRTSIIGGTYPYWMAPEMAAARNYSFKADVWALGIITIEMIEQDPPHYYEDSHTAQHLIAINGAPTLKEPSDSSTETNRFLAECLRVDVDRRPASEELLRHAFFRRRV
ncbi:kinase-like domain-containing protein [Mycena rebaudengoi]|nr:kinase-like domain-containing protein [Mycena rebaudengoi]